MHLLKLHELFGDNFFNILFLFVLVCLETGAKVTTILISYPHICKQLKILCLNVSCIVAFFFYCY